MADRPQSVDDLLSETFSTCGEAAGRVATRIVEWSEEQRLKPTVTPRNPKKGIGFQPVIRGIPDWEPFPIGLYPGLGTVVVEIGWLQKRKPFDSQALRDQLRSKIAEAVPEVDWSRKSHFPDVSLQVLSREKNLERFLKVIDWAIQRIRKLYSVD